MSTTRISAADLSRFLDSGAAPVYMLDEDRRIIFISTACAEWLGVSADALLGQQCSYHSPAGDTTPASLAAGLCPPPQVFSGRTQTALVSCPRPGGRTVHRRGHFLPLAAGDDEGAPVVAILECVDAAPDAPHSEASSTADLHEQVRRFRRQMAGRFSPERLIGRHPLIKRARAQIETAARSGASVLVVGLPGSGKEHAAKAIHYGQTEPGLLVPIDCAVMEANLVRSTLRTLCARRAGRPPGSTLLLENVSSLAAEAQQELLEVLRDGTLHMRVTATTSTPLAERMAEGAFSQELACALSTLVIELPPLADRVEDLPLLVQALVEELNLGRLRQLAGFSPEAIDQLAAYPWPGNLDELTALVREMHEKSQGTEVVPRDLPRTIHWGAEAASHPQRGDDTIVLEEFLGRVEKELIARAMRRAKGNKSRAAKMLGLTRPRLYRRLVQLGLEQPEDKKSS
jgi:DNA-binding NtrC family response regulator